MIGEPVDAPPTRGSGPNWAKELAEIMDHPNQWFIYRSVPRRKPEEIKNTYLKRRFPDIYCTTSNYHGGPKGRSRCDMYLIYEPDGGDFG